MNFVDAVSSCLTNYATFNGRADRSEFWFFALFQFLVSIVLNFLPYGELGFLLLLLPSLAVGARRLHDIGMSGWWQLIVLTGIGYIALLVLWALPTREE